LAHVFYFFPRTDDALRQRTISLHLTIALFPRQAKIRIHGLSQSTDYKIRRQHNTRYLNRRSTDYHKKHDTGENGNGQMTLSRLDELELNGKGPPFTYNQSTCISSCQTVLNELIDL
jgi:hypothetical protein